MKPFRYHLWATLVASTVLLPFGVRSAQAQNLTLTLDNGGVFTGPTNNQIIVTGTLTNADMTDVDLSSASINGAFLPDPGGALSDDFSFLLSGTLPGGQSEAFTFFTLDTSGIPGGTSYVGSFAVNATGVDQTTPFTSGSEALNITVEGADTAAAPEPSTWAAFVCTGLGVGGLMLRGRQRRGVGGGVASSLLGELR